VGQWVGMSLKSPSTMMKKRRRKRKINILLMENLEKKRQQKRLSLRRKPEKRKRKRRKKLLPGINRVTITVAMVVDMAGMTEMDMETTERYFGIHDDRRAREGACKIESIFFVSYNV
jgi:hypothetical protein